jgi:hypothetical protein
MEMQQMMVLLLAMRKERETDKEEIKTGHKELLAKMDADRKAAHEDLMAKMEANQEEMKADRKADQEKADADRVQMREFMKTL